ncbi:hypothetical protein BD769DRAFT_1490209 [Suillus cothurnatus]|nr:hypothetical protein BD769DRAFT_1490209 [Suillus cothurnatus]
MNNLLRTLTESQVKPSPDLRLLLSAVKDARRQSFDAKVSEPFYDSLEGLLHDLRTVTMITTTRRHSLSQLQNPMSPTTTMVRAYPASNADLCNSHLRHICACARNHCLGWHTSR